MEYTLCIPTEEIGIRKSCLTPVVLAVATLDRLLHHRMELYSGDDVKINHAKVLDLLNQVGQVVAKNQHIQQLWGQLIGSLRAASEQFMTPEV